LEKIEFSSQWKKMSVIVKIEKNGNQNHDMDLTDKSEILVLTKGSDDVVLNDLDIENSPDLNSVKKSIKILSR